MLGKSSAVVVGRFDLGESDLLVTFFTRQYGLLRGVAKRARRMTSRFGGALEIFTSGELIFFDGGRRELVQVDHFDIARPFARLREDLERLGHAAWITECVSRLTAERDPNPAVYGLLVRALAAIDQDVPPRRVAVVFGVRCIDALGHRLRLDACVGCRRPLLRPATSLAIDLEGGGVVCDACAGTGPGVPRLSPAVLTALKRLRVSAWSEATAVALGRAEVEIRELLDAQMTHLVGRPSRASRFLREVVRQQDRAPSAALLPGDPA